MLVSNLSTSTRYLQHRAALTTDYVFEYTHLYFIHLELFSGAKTCENVSTETSMYHVSQVDQHDSDDLCTKLEHFKSSQSTFP